MIVCDIERRGKGRAIIHFQGFGSAWINRVGRKWVMDCASYGKWAGNRLPREGEEI